MCSAAAILHLFSTAHDFLILELTVAQSSKITNTQRLDIRMSGTYYCQTTLEYRMNITYRLLNLGEKYCHVEPVSIHVVH